MAFLHNNAPCQKRHIYRPPLVLFVFMVQAPSSSYKTEMVNHPPKVLMRGLSQWTGSALLYDNAHCQERFTFELPLALLVIMCRAASSCYTVKTVALQRPMQLSIHCSYCMHGCPVTSRV